MSFDDIDYNDPKQLRAAQQSMVREQWIRVEALKVMRHALEKCFQTQGNNQYENCKDLAGMLFFFFFYIYIINSIRKDAN